MPRLPTGLKRIVPVIINMNVDEDEWLTRKSFQKGISKTKFVLRKIIGREFLQELPALRYEQRKQKRSFRRQHYDGVFRTDGKK